MVTLPEIVTLITNYSPPIPCFSLLQTPKTWKAEMLWRSYVRSLKSVWPLNSDDWLKCGVSVAVHFSTDSIEVLFLQLTRAMGQGLGFLGL